VPTVTPPRRTGRPRTAPTPCRRSAEARSGQPFGGHVGAADDGVVHERLSAGTLPGVAPHYSEHAPGPSDAATWCGTFCPSASMMSLPVTPKGLRTPRSRVAARQPCQELVRPGWRVGAGWRPGPRDQSLWRVRFASMARHCSVEIAVVIVLDHGLAQGRVEPLSPRALAGGRLPVHSAPIRHTPSGIWHLDHAEYFDLCWPHRPQCALIMA
jgi:hypothetical protein